MPLRKGEKNLATIDVPQELLDDLRECQEANPELQGLGLDDLVAVALVKYLRKNMPHEESIRISERGQRIRVDSPM